MSPNDMLRQAADLLTSDAPWQDRDALQQKIRAHFDAQKARQAEIMAAIAAAPPEARVIQHDGGPVFFSKESDEASYWRQDPGNVRDCPHCGGEGVIAEPEALQPNHESPANSKPGCTGEQE